MRNVCHVDILVGPRDKLVSPSDVAKRLFADLKSCRLLSAALVGPRLSAALLLPEIRGGYGDVLELKFLIEQGLTGKGVVLVSVHGLREATAAEVLERTLAQKR